MSCIYKCGYECRLHFEGFGIPDSCIEENCELWSDDDDENDEESE